MERLVTDLVIKKPESVVEKNIFIMNILKLNYIFIYSLKK